VTETGAEAKSDRLAMIRGDLAAPYGAVQQVMNICSKVRIYRIEVGAAAPNISR
jgi:biopolymer transport protein ExbD